MDTEDAQPDIEARLYYLEREVGRLAQNAYRDRGTINAAVVRIALIEAKTALWASVVGAAVGGLISWLLHR